MSEVDQVYPEFFASERDFLVAVQALVDKPPQGFCRVDDCNGAGLAIESTDKIPGYDVAAYRFESYRRDPFYQARALLPGPLSTDGVPTQRRYGMPRNASMDLHIFDYPHPDNLALTVHESIGVVATAEGIGSFDKVLRNVIARALDVRLHMMKGAALIDMKYPLPPEDIALVALELQQLAKKGV